MVEGVIRQRIRLNQCISRTFDFTNMAGGMQQTTHQGCFTGTQIAMQINDKAWLYGSCQSGAKIQRCSFVCQFKCKIVSHDELQLYQ